jgi:hypothetical protein
MTTPMTRREAVIRMATLMGATALGPRLLAATFSSGNHGFSADDVALLDEIGETIIPTTNVPGAKATQIGAFIAMMVNDCYPPAEQTLFRDGLKKVADTYRTRFGSTFVAGTPANRTTLLDEFDREQRAYTQSKTTEQPPHFFRVMKELTILGYFSSEIGATQALRFIEVPGRFDGAAPYKKGDRAWFS